MHGSVGSIAFHRKHKQYFLSIKTTSTKLLLARVLLVQQRLWSICSMNSPNRINRNGNSKTHKILSQTSVYSRIPVIFLTLHIPHQTEQNKPEGERTNSCGDLSISNPIKWILSHIQIHLMHFRYIMPRPNTERRCALEISLIGDGVPQHVHTIFPFCCFIIILCVVHRTKT